MCNVFIFPTDTVYGIGCSIYDQEAQKKIYEIKGRDFNKPLAVLCANLEQIEEIAVVDDFARRLILNYLPGGLTLILKSKPKIQQIINSETIGVRIPNHLQALEILREKGPMTTTSVNQSGEPPLNDYHKIVEKYGKFVKKVWEPLKNQRVSMVSSTVVNLTVSPIQVVRQGEIKLEDILKFQ